MQGDVMPPCRVSCALMSYYRTNDDYAERRDEMNLIYIVECDGNRIGCMDVEDLSDNMRSNTNYDAITAQENTAENIIREVGNTPTRLIPRSFRGTGIAINRIDNPVAEPIDPEEFFHGEDDEPEEGPEPMIQPPPMPANELGDE